MQLRKLLRVAIPIIMILFLSVSFARAQEDETTYYFLTDHLGSTDVVLDEDGNVVERADYKPFGSNRLRITETDAPDTDYKYTGKEMDDETGLMYYSARYYDSDLGRFISFDPLLLNEGSKPLTSVLMNPQELNPYSYTTNNPIIMIDESGEYQKDVHYDLTYYLGLISGLGHSDSKTIAYYNQWTDDNPETMPFSIWHPIQSAKNYLNDVTEYYHFATREDALSRLNNALINNSLESFGTALHTFQDTYSHGGLTPDEHIDLNRQGKNPDYTYLTTASIAKATRMARATFFQLRKINLELNGTGDLTKDEYLQQSTEIWLRNKDKIASYLSQEDKTGTTIETLARISEESKNEED